MKFNLTTDTNDKTKFYNPEDVIAIIQSSLNQIVISDPGYEGYSYKIANEQYYVPDEDRHFDKNTIFCVIKMMKATLDFNQVIVPFTLTAISEHNNISVCQRLLLEYTQTYNLTDGTGETTDPTTQTTTTFMYKQTYDSPVVTSNFNEVYDGYRSVFTLTGNILINYSVYPIKKINYYHNATGFAQNELGVATEIKTLSNAFAFDNTLDSQAYSGKNRTESISKFGTLTLSFTTYSETNDLIKTLIALSLQKSDREEQLEGAIPNDRCFYFGLVFRGTSDEERLVRVKLNNFNYSQALGQFPTITMSFTE